MDAFIGILPRVYADFKYYMYMYVDFVVGEKDPCLKQCLHVHTLDRYA